MITGYYYNIIHDPESAILYQSGRFVRWPIRSICWHEGQAG